MEHSLRAHSARMHRGAARPLSRGRAIHRARLRVPLARHLLRRRRRGIASYRQAVAAAQARQQVKHACAREGVKAHKLCRIA